jgi:hypothetical protein
LVSLVRELLANRPFPEAKPPMQPRTAKALFVISLLVVAALIALVFKVSL